MSSEAENPAQAHGFYVQQLNVIWWWSRLRATKTCTGSWFLHPLAKRDMTAIVSERNRNLHRHMVFASAGFARYDCNRVWEEQKPAQAHAFWKEKSCVLRFAYGKWACLCRPPGDKNLHRLMLFQQTNTSWLDVFKHRYSLTWIRNVYRLMDFAPTGSILIELGWTLRWKNMHGLMAFASSSSALYDYDRIWKR